jgi:flagellar biosynthesis regulator FlaF
MEMIVIPPSADSEKYFIEFAKRVWSKQTFQNMETEDQMKKELKTLVISCDLEMEGKTVRIKLHYRFLRDSLYCFVEESE